VSGGDGLGAIRKPIRTLLTTDKEGKLLEESVTSYLSTRGSGREKHQIEGSTLIDGKKETLVTASHVMVLGRGRTVFLVLSWGWGWYGL